MMPVRSQVPHKKDVTTVYGPLYMYHVVKMNILHEINGVEYESDVLPVPGSNTVCYIYEAHKTLAISPIMSCTTILPSPSHDGDGSHRI